VDSESAAHNDSKESVAPHQARRSLTSAVGPCGVTMTLGSARIGDGTREIVRREAGMGENRVELIAADPTKLCARKSPCPHATA
jgi:hypothetical protein